MESVLGLPPASMEALAANGEASGDISAARLAISFGVIVLESAVAQVLSLEIGDQLLISGIRAFVQLSCLGFILRPIFAADNPAVVMAYIFGFMILVSAHEAVARPKITYPGMFRDGVCSLGASLLCSGMVLLAIVTPSPWYNAQYLIPLAGMLINNSLSGVALALNQMIDYLTTNKDYLEVLLAFGATPWEAAWPGFRKSAQAALIPAINGMNVVGLVSIPGMMTGQILGGASPLKAAEYQIVITFLISGCTFMAVALTCGFTTRAFFDARGRHDTSRVTKQARLKVAQWVDPRLWWRKAKAGQAAAPGDATPGGPGEPLLGAEAGQETSPLRLVGPESPPAGAVLDLDLQGAVGGGRPLEAALRLRAREVLCIMGPSGIGKSTLLRWIADLRPPGSERAMRLGGRDRGAMSAQAWRRDVHYMHQSKAPLPGSPADLLGIVRKLRAQQGRALDEVGAIMQSVGLAADLIERPWSDLSGGEAQRTLLSIALATSPACLLLDEPTSALDELSKGLVEAALRSSGASVLLVTHDEAQAGRLGGVVLRISER